MNLIERLLMLSVGADCIPHGDAAAEAAGEVERCWAEINSNEHEALELKAQVSMREAAIVALEAEIERLKAAKDLEALAAAETRGYQHGFRTATATLWPVVGTLLKDRTHGPQDSH